MTGRLAESEAAFYRRDGFLVSGRGVQRDEARLCLDRLEIVERTAGQEFCKDDNFKPPPPSGGA
jgi:hypothetical protein